MKDTIRYQCARGASLRRQAQVWLRIFRANGVPADMDTTLWMVQNIGMPAWFYAPLPAP